MCHNCVFGAQCARKNPNSPKAIVLVGPPNVGKSSIFNILSNKYTEISNYPGTTVSLFNAKTEFGDLLDTPGIYSFLDYQSEDEEITKNSINNSSYVINIISALTLERDLILTTQLLEMNVKMILVINQMDEAQRRGILIDIKKISQKLGIDVVGTSVKKNLGLGELLESIKRLVSTKTFPQHKKIDDKIDFIKQIICEAVQKNPKNECLADKISSLLFHPIIGWLTAIGILYALFKILGVIIAGNVVDLLTSQFDEYITPLFDSIVSLAVSEGLFKHILVGEFGVFTMGLKLIFTILLPLIVGYYTIISLLEDSGYLPRLAVLTDGFFSKFGLNGRAAIPILLGFGCSAIGILSSRVLHSKKERIIATAIIAMAIPCAAQQGIIMVLLASVNNCGILLVYLITILTVLFATGKILNFLIPGEKTDLLIDIPPLRLPSIKNCAQKTYFRSKSFLEEAFGVFMISSVIITLLDDFHILVYLQDAMAPIVKELLNLPKKFVEVLIMGIIRRDFAAAQILNMAHFCDANALSNTQILTAVIVITLFVPCINALIIICKERSVKEAALLWIISFILAISAGMIPRSFETCFLGGEPPLA